MKLSRLLALVLVLAGTIGIAYWLRQGDKTEIGRVASGGRLVATARSEPKSFNRLVSVSAADDLVAKLTQGTLVRVNRVSGELEPRLAREWSQSADGLSWTFKLRENVTFSDGTPFTTADVLFTFQALYDDRVASPLAATISVDGKPLLARALDAQTVVITFPAVYGPGISILDVLPMLPRHKLAAALESGTFRGAWSTTTAPAEIVGLGPFVLREHAPGARVVFARNPRFWRRDENGQLLPYLDEIQIDIVPETNAEVLRLESGSADLINDQVRPEDLAALRKKEVAGDLRIVDAGISPDPNVLWFNLVPGAAVAKGRPWLQKEALRFAISHAVSRQMIVDTVHLGAAVPVFGPVTPGHGEWYVADLPGTSFDVQRAKTLLGSIGLTDRNGDGTVEDEAGKPARFSILTHKGHTERERTVAVIQQQLRQAGLTVDVVATDPGTILARFNKGEYDAIFFYTPGDSVDPAARREFWLSSGAFHFWNPRQAKPATEWEASIDDLIRRQAGTLDRPERRRLFAEAQRLLAAHLPVLCFAAPKVSIAMSSRVHGATPSVLRPPVLWNAEVVSVTGTSRGAGRQ